ncbi:hypothetical protein [Halovivax sp.]|uniref:DUF7553 family protein n=1 Tax=Halovivax sp. TaxID=1935978 RepID=UPI0025BD67A0|nr:hypothetical protein [Halovivax sp.]
MNKHFRDAAYYGRRASEHTKLGLLETVRPVRSRIDQIRGVEPEPNGRLEGLLTDVRELEVRAESEARERLTSARTHLEPYRRST